MKKILLLSLFACVGLRADTMIASASLDPWDALYITGFEPDYSLGPSIYSGTELWSQWEAEGVPASLAASQAAHFIAGYRFVEVPAPTAPVPEPSTFAIAAIGIVMMLKRRKS